MRPITAQPGHSAAEVEDALESGQFVFADCYTIIPKVGDVMRYTSTQQNVSLIPLDETVLYKTFYAKQVIISGLLVKNSIGIEVDQQEVGLAYPQGIAYQGYLTWAQALLQGRLDGARIRRDRYIATAFNGANTDWLGGFPMFLGLVSSLTTVGRQSATVNVKSDLVNLDVQMPKDLFTPNCNWTWGDPNCGVDQEAFGVNGTVGASPGRSTIPWGGATAAYALGKIHIQGGDSVLRVRTISRVAGGNLYLSYPLDFDPAPGDPFRAYPNCKRMKDNCILYHGGDWVNKFRGFPFVPVAETAIG